MYHYSVVFYHRRMAAFRCRSSRFPIDFVSISKYKRHSIQQYRDEVVSICILSNNVVPVPSTSQQISRSSKTFSRVTSDRRPRRRTSCVLFLTKANTSNACFCIKRKAQHKNNKSLFLLVAIKIKGWTTTMRNRSDPNSLASGEKLRASFLRPLFARPRRRIRVRSNSESFFVF